MRLYVGVPVKITSGPNEGKSGIIREIQAYSEPALKKNKITKIPIPAPDYIIVLDSGEAILVNESQLAPSSNRVKTTRKHKNA